MYYEYVSASSARTPNQDKKLNSKFSATINSFLLGRAAGSGNLQEKPHNSAQSKVDLSSEEQPQTSSPQNQKFSNQSALTTQQKLDLLEQTLDGLEVKRAQDQEKSSVSTPEAPAASSRKEAPLEGGAAPIEQAASIQYVEEEKLPELSPEVEKYLQEVKEQQEKAPQEIVIADTAQDLPSQDEYVSEPVVVVPITPEIEKKGKGKPPKFSVRWLVEWSQKIIKMFAGKVAYRQVEQPS